MSLSSITDTGPYQAIWNTTPEIDQPPECQVPADPWPRLNLDPINPPTIPMECEYKFPQLQIEPFFSQEFPEIPPAVPGAEAPFEFQVVNTTGNKVQAQGGNLPLGSSCILAVPTLPEVTLATNQTVMFWLQLKRADGNEADGFDNSCCTIEIKHAPWKLPIEDGPITAGDWTSYPTQINDPFISRKLIGYSTQTSSGVVTTYVNKGGLTAPWEGFVVADYKAFKVYVAPGSNCAGGGIGCWDIYVKGGRITWGKSKTDVADYYTTVDVGSHYYIWVQVDDVTSESPTFTIEEGSTGWAEEGGVSFPDDCNSPVKYFLLADVQSNVYGIINIVDSWIGGDITWGLNSYSNYDITTDIIWEMGLKGKELTMGETADLAGPRIQLSMDNTKNAKAVFKAVDEGGYASTEVLIDTDVGHVQVWEHAISDDWYLQLRGNALYLLEGVHPVAIDLSLDENRNAQLIMNDADDGGTTVIVLDTAAGVITNTDNSASPATYTQISAGEVLIYLDDENRTTINGGDIYGDNSDFGGSVTDTTFGWKTFTWGEQGDSVNKTAFLGSADIDISGMTQTFSVVNSVSYDGTDIWVNWLSLEFTNGLLTNMTDEGSTSIATAAECPA